MEEQGLVNFEEEMSNAVSVPPYCLLQGSEPVLCCAVLCCAVLIDPTAQGLDGMGWDGMCQLTNVV